MSAILRILVLVSVLAAAAAAQWLNHPSAGLPRKTDGKPDLAAPMPKTADGKPDLSGVWIPADTKYFMDLAADLKPEDAPYQPWAKALATERQGGVHKEDPLAQCMPPGVPRVETHGGHPFKIIQTPRELIMLYETSTNEVFREVFTDGRALPNDPQPSWKGYSVGRWEGDTMVIDTIGFNDRSWIDTEKGRPQTEALHVTERFRRRNAGTLELGITIDDPKAYTKPWSAKFNLNLVPDTELIETVCENSRNVEHMVGK